MKVAFVFSGIIRELNKTTEIFQKKIQEFNADVYASFWDIENSKEGDTIENFKINFNPKQLEIESWGAWKKSTWDILKEEINPPLDLYKHGHDQVNNGNFFAMWYKIWRANSLTKLTPEPYDIIVRLRTDLILSDWYKPEINPYLNIPHGTILIQNWLNCYGPHDFIAYSNPKIMDQYSSMFLYATRYLKEGVYIFAPENVLRHHLGQFNIPIRYYGDRILLRDGGNVGRDNPTKADIYIPSRTYKTQEQDPKLTFYKERV
jgi:hypothetical protein